VVECESLVAVPVIRILKLPRGVFPVAAIVRVDVAPWLLGVTLAGEKLQFAPLGNPKQESETTELKLPPNGLTTTVIFAACPCFTEADEGVALIEKSTPTPLRFTLRVAGVIPSEPVTLSSPKRVPGATGLNVIPNRHELPARTPSGEQVLLWE
jgi:hypothetical protein